MRCNSGPKACVTEPPAVHAGLSMHSLGWTGYKASTLIAHAAVANGCMPLIANGQRLLTLADQCDCGATITIWL